MIEQAKVTQPLEQVTPQDEMPANVSKTFSLSFSLLIVAREKLRVSGDLTMQQTKTFHDVPPRASLGAQTQETVQLEQTTQLEQYPVKPLPKLRYAPQSEQWTFPGGTGALLTIVVLIIASAYILPFFTQMYNQWHFGDSRISQLDATIAGRHDHFIAETTRDKRVIVLDLRNNDVAKMQVFVSPQKATIEHAVITLSRMFVDGHEAIVVQVEDQQVASILYSNGDSFSWDIPPSKKG